VFWARCEEPTLAVVVGAAIFNQTARAYPGMDKIKEIEKMRDEYVDKANEVKDKCTLGKFRAVLPNGKVIGKCPATGICTNKWIAYTS
jgi:hypothetical protein